MAGISDYDWSPDSKWVVLAQYNDNFNSDIFLLPLDGSKKPFNLSRHPDHDIEPVWQPDGKIIAFTGRRHGDETDIYYVQLLKKEDKKNQYDRKLEEAVKKMNQNRKTKQKTNNIKELIKKILDDSKNSLGSKKIKQIVNVSDTIIDFESTYKRIRRIPINGSNEASLFWSHDSKNLAFSNKISGKKGTYTISMPYETSPKYLCAKTGSNSSWISKDNQIVWLVNGIPSSIKINGKESTYYDFSIRSSYKKFNRNMQTFYECWLIIKDHYYDKNLNFKNWNKIFEKYSKAARNAPDAETLDTVIELMLGELNGSHLGFNTSDSHSFQLGEWKESTVHLGIRFESQFDEDGLKIRDILPDGSAESST